MKFTLRCEHEDRVIERDIELEYLLRPDYRRAMRQLTDRMEIEIFDAPRER